MVDIKSETEGMIALQRDQCGGLGLRRLVIKLHNHTDFQITPNLKVVLENSEIMTMLSENSVRVWLARLGQLDAFTAQRDRLFYGINNSHIL